MKTRPSQLARIAATFSQLRAANDERREDEKERNVSRRANPSGSDVPDSRRDAGKRRERAAYSTARI